MAFLTLLKSLAPKNCAIMIVDPIETPITSEISTNITGKDPPTAASASSPS